MLLGERDTGGTRRSQVRSLRSGLRGYGGAHDGGRWQDAAAVDADARRVRDLGRRRAVRRPAPDGVLHRRAAPAARQADRARSTRPRRARCSASQGYATLADVPFPVDVVDVFRRSEAAGEFADQAVAVGARGVWFQLGVIDEDAFGRTVAAGVPMVMDTCPAIEWRADADRGCRRSRPDRRHRRDGHRAASRAQSLTGRAARRRRLLGVRRLLRGTHCTGAPRLLARHLLGPLLRRIGYHVSVLTRNVDQTFFIRLFAGRDQRGRRGLVVQRRRTAYRSCGGAPPRPRRRRAFYGGHAVHGRRDCRRRPRRRLRRSAGAGALRRRVAAPSPARGFLIDFLLKEGQGMGAQRIPRPHRRVRLELHGPRADRGARRRRLRPQDRADPEADKNPAGTACTSTATSRSSATSAGRGSRAGRWPVCVRPPSNEADCAPSCVMAIESIAPQVRTVVSRSTTPRTSSTAAQQADEHHGDLADRVRLLARSRSTPAWPSWLTDIAPAARAPSSTG